jgi:hypothetical protein
VELLGTWGDPYYIGLTGLEVLGADGTALTLDQGQMSAHPLDLNCIPGYSGDDRTIDKLIDGVNQTTDDRHMWLTPFDPEGTWVEIDLGNPTPLSALSFWNYNKNADDTYRGVKSVRVLIDGTLACAPSGLVVRKAPGEALFDFRQTLKLRGVRGCRRP